MIYVDTKHGGVCVKLYRYDVIKGCGNMYSAPSDIDYYGGVELDFDVIENEGEASEDDIIKAIIEYMGDA